MKTQTIDKLEKTNRKILIIEDEPDIIELMTLHLEREGFIVESALDGYMGITAAECHLPQLIILDLMLPGLSGLDICKRLKQDPGAKFYHIPIIMVTAKSSEEDIIAGLELGASDYITKPFSPAVLISRVKVCLRDEEIARKSRLKANTLKFGNYELDLGQHCVRFDHQRMGLTLTEFNMLCRFLNNRGHILTREQLLNEVDSDSDSIIDRNIDVHIYSIRRKLGPNFKWIETVRSVGYRFIEE
jgi:DNA-binding response OmpR family regulator